MPSLISEYVPQVASGEVAARWRRAGLLAWGLGTCAALLWLGLILLAPALRAHGSHVLAAAVYQSFSVACHQIPERSFHFQGFPLAVCARCFGLYVGTAAGIAAYPLLRSLSRAEAPERWWLLAAALPVSLDYVLGVLGVWENTHLSRFLTALVLGAVAAFFIMPGLVDLSRRRFQRHDSGAFDGAESPERRRAV